MKKLFNRIMVISILLFGLIFAVNLTLAPKLIHADTAAQEACQGVGVVSGSSCTTTGNAPSPDSIIATAVNILSIVVGVIAVFMIVIGGIRFVMSGGDSSATNSARNTVIYAVVGLVVAFMGQILVKFVLNKIGK